MTTSAQSEVTNHAAVERNAHTAMRAWSLMALDMARDERQRAIALGETSAPARPAAGETSPTLHDLIARRFPTHGIASGEGQDAGRIGHQAVGGWRWLTDPVAGSLDHLTCLPGATSSMALLWGDEVRVGAVTDLSSQAVISARRGGGLCVDPPRRRVALHRAAPQLASSMFVEMGTDGLSLEVLRAWAGTSSAPRLSIRVVETSAVALVEAALAGGVFVGIHLRHREVAGGLRIAEESGLRVRTWVTTRGLDAVAAPNSEIDAVTAVVDGIRAARDARRET